MQVKEQVHKHRGLKVRRPRHGFFSRRKLARGKLNRRVRNEKDRHESRHQCLEEMVLSRERAIQSLRRELEMVVLDAHFMIACTIVNAVECIKKFCVNCSCLKLWKSDVYFVCQRNHRHCTYNVIHSSW